MLALVGEAETIAMVVATTTIVMVVATTTSAIMVVAENRSNPIFDTNFIVGPTVSTPLTTVVVALTSSPVIRMPQSTPIKWLDGQRTHRGGVALSLPEMVGGGVGVI